MKEDVLKFRKLCDILINEKEMTVNKIVIESGITWPTIKTLREEDIDNIHIKSSILGRIQDYLKKHCEDMNYAGIKSETFVEKTEKELGEQFIKEQTEEILAGERKAEFDADSKKPKLKEKDLGPVRESEKVTSAGTTVHMKTTVIGKLHNEEKKEPLSVKETRKYIKKDKGNVSKVVKINEPDVIESKSLVQIILFLKMEATKYRKLANDFDAVADQLLNNK